MRSRFHVDLSFRAGLVAMAIEDFSMIFGTRLLSRLTVLAALVGTVLIPSVMNRVPAQQAGKGQERLLYEEKDYKAKLPDIKAMFQGDMPADKKTLDLAAQHFAYRLTWTDLQIKHGQMPLLVREAINEIKTTRSGDRSANELFNAALLARLKEVLPNPRPIASFNAAQVLAYMAGQGQEGATDALAEALSDKDMNPATKYCAARGIHDFLMLAFAAEEEQKVRFKDKEREARTIKALLAALDTRLPENPAPSEEEINGIRALRREVIRALGASRYPALTDANGALQGKTALALARVLRNDGFNPTPRLDEQVEAAIGLARLKVSPDPNYKSANEYQLDVAAHHLGRFLLDLSRRHQNHKNDEKDHPETKQPWKVIGARLGVALGSLSAEANLLRRNGSPKYKPSYEFVNELVKVASPVLKGIEADGTAPADQLGDVVEKSPREKEPIYKGDDSSVVKPGSNALTTEPAKDKLPAEEKK
jgi:hypothetical protein